MVPPSTYIVWLSFDLQIVHLVLQVLLGRFFLFSLKVQGVLHDFYYFADIGPKNWLKLFTEKVSHIMYDYFSFNRILSTIK